MESTCADTVSVCVCVCVCVSVYSIPVQTLLLIPQAPFLLH